MTNTRESLGFPGTLTQEGLALVGKFQSRFSGQRIVSSDEVMSVFADDGAEHSAFAFLYQGGLEALLKAFPGARDTVERDTEGKITARGWILP